MKIKEITEGVISRTMGALGDIIDRQNASGYGSDFQKWRNWEPKAAEKDSEENDTEKSATDDTAVDTAVDTAGQDEPKDQQEKPRQEKPKPRQQQQQPRPKNNPNQNINTKIDYLKSIGVLQSARITDDEKQYIESTDVWVDTNKLENIDPGTTFFQTRAPHHHMFIRQIVVPARDLGYENNINYQFDLTPAGWWSSMHRAYLNPNSKLGRLVDDWADRN